MMSEWKGPRKCEKCGRLFFYPNDIQETEQAGVHSNLAGGSAKCRGKLLPHDRRAPDPRVAALEKQIRELEAEARTWRSPQQILRLDAEARAEALEAELGRMTANAEIERLDKEKAKAECRRLREAAERYCTYHEAIITMGPECDCPAEGHICGWPRYKRATEDMRAALTPPEVQGQESARYNAAQMRDAFELGHDMALKKWTGGMRLVEIANALEWATAEALRRWPERRATGPQGGVGGGKP